MSSSLPNRLLYILFFCIVSANDNALEIAKSVNSMNATKGILCEIKMKISDSNNRTSNLHIKSISKNNREMQMLWVLSPPEDRGVAMCKIDNEDRDEIKVWLPAFEKIKKISSKRRSDSFMGSDISYEDMGQRNLEDYNYELAPDTTILGKDCYSLISTPLNKKNTSYSSHVTYVEKLSHLPIYEVSYNSKSRIEKTKKYEYILIDDIYTLNSLYVKNIITGNSTDLNIENIIIDDNIPDNAFNQSKLKRIPIE